ncbi:MAG: DUF2273 domain-containing protein [Eggerthellaceae bacterium]|nr:DUF2273 domain-containing protein [Eggerthellaceae bacterium]
MTSENVSVRVGRSAPRRGAPQGGPPDRAATRAATGSEGAAPPQGAKEAKTSFERFASSHAHAFAYAAVGLAAAVLILAIGILPTLLVAALVALGFAIGRTRDSGTTLGAVASNLSTHLK